MLPCTNSQKSSLGLSGSRLNNGTFCARSLVVTHRPVTVPGSRDAQLALVDSLPTLLASFAARRAIPAATLILSVYAVASENTSDNAIAFDALTTALCVVHVACLFALVSGRT